ncbi:hypothetical protein FRB91_003641 [Serendipita sp. 411]|nr:hypothetical protein FRC19_004070 [Serendipita sp. 401]KAG8843025.1 hypothetical protein FRB91_003641 [Serendipita sp. 411]KAG9032281.1 hypothetical protein FS842_004107 [Serendipita sp. 407]
MNARQLVQHQGSSIVLISPHDPIYAHQVTTRPIYEQLVYAAVTATVTQFSLELFYTALAIVCVGIFNIDPAAFPHFFCEPLSIKTDSVHSIWGQRWHHIFRRVTTRALDPWLHILRIPKKSTVGTACKVLAAFTLSGLIHCVVQARVQSLHFPPEIPLVIFDVDTLWFFLSQPFAIAFEHLFVMPLAHRLPPPIGFVVKRLWTWGWLLWSGRWWTDVWIKMGMFLVEERTIPFSVVRGIQRGEWIVQWG